MESTSDVDGPGFAADGQLPRAQAGSSPQHLLITLLGDYWLGRADYLPSAALIRLLAEFGVSEVGGRAALNRLSRRGHVNRAKHGRRTYYHLSPEAARRVGDGARLIVSFGSDQTWNSVWCVVAFSVPEDQRDTRHLLRSRLRWLGFAPLYDAVWVSPTGRVDSVYETLTELGVTTATVFTSTLVNGTTKAPISAWDLDEVKHLYQDFILTGTHLISELRNGRVTPAQALVARTRLMDTYRRFPAIDPQIPSTMMPARWPRTEARDLFITAYDGLGPLATARVQQIINEFEPGLGNLATFRTVAELTSPRT